MTMLKIGLEIHVKLLTASKLFCACPAAFGLPPNTSCCPVCLGFPGALPSLNREAVEKAIKACLMVQASIDRHSSFDRKHYASADMPKGYQITQEDRPIGRGGRLTDPQGSWSVDIRQLHLEEDAAKLIHAPDRRTTRIDFNRSGLPLLEVVTEPDLVSADQAVSFLTLLRQLMVHAGVTDGRMEAGSFRVDVNVSVKNPDAGSSGRVEIKNLNSFRAVDQAIVFEEKRLRQFLKNGRQTDLQTRRWDDQQRRTVAMRSKSSQTSYRYLPEMDLGVLEVDDLWIKKALASLPEWPHEKSTRYQKTYGLTSQDSDQLVDDPYLSRLFEQTVSFKAAPQQAAGWLLGPFRHALRDRQLRLEDQPVTARQLADLITAVDNKTINRVSGERLLELVMDRQEDPLDLIESMGLQQVSDQQTLDGLLDQVLEANPGAVADWRQGKAKAWHFLVGQVMKQTGGKADIEAVEKGLTDRLQG